MAKQTETVAGLWGRPSCAGGRRIRSGGRGRGLGVGGGRGPIGRQRAR